VVLGKDQNRSARWAQNVKTSLVSRNFRALVGLGLREHAPAMAAMHLIISSV
jgi:hypothetical protein